MKIWDYFEIDRVTGGGGVGSSTEPTTHDMILDMIGMTTLGQRAKVIANSNINVLREDSVYAEALEKAEEEKRRRIQIQEEKKEETFKDEEYMAKVDQRHFRSMVQSKYAKYLSDILSSKLAHVSNFKDFIPRNTKNLIKTHVIDFLNQSSGENLHEVQGFVKSLEIEYSMVDLDYAFMKDKNTFEPRFKPQVSSTTLDMTNKFFEKLAEDSDAIQKTWRYTSNVTYDSEDLTKLPISMDKLPESFLPENYEFRKVYVKEEGKGDGVVSYQLKSKVLTHDGSSELFGMRLNIAEEIDLPIPKGKINKIDKDLKKKYQRDKDSIVYTIFSSSGEKMWEVEVSTITVTRGVKSKSFVTRGVEIEFVGNMVDLVTRGEIYPVSNDNVVVGSFEVSGETYIILNTGVVMTSDDVVVGFFNSSQDTTRIPHTVFSEFQYIQDLAMKKDITQDEEIELQRLRQLRDAIFNSLSTVQKDAFRRLKRSESYKPLIQDINTYLEGGQPLTAVESIIGLLSFCKNTGFVRSFEFPQMRENLVNYISSGQFVLAKQGFMNLYKKKKIPLEIERGYIAFEFNRLTYYTDNQNGKRVVFKKQRNDILGRTWNTMMRNIQVSDNLDSKISTDPTLKLDGLRSLFLFSVFGNYILIPPMGIYKVSGATINKDVGISVLDGEFYYPTLSTEDQIPQSHFEKVGLIPIHPTFKIQDETETQDTFANIEAEFGFDDSSDEDEAGTSSPVIVQKTVPYSHLRGFYAFDIMVFRGENIMKRGFSMSSSRKIKPRKLELYDFVESLQGKSFSDHEIPNELNFMALGGDQFNIFSKKFYGGRKDALDAFMSLSVNNSSYDLDGLVLQNKGKYHQISLKWKPPEMMTIDFLVGERVNEGASSSTHRIYKAFTTGNKQFKFNNLEAVITIPVSDTDPIGKIHECLFVESDPPHLMFRTIRHRYDKPYANSYNTAFRNFKDIMSPISTRTLLNSDNTASRKYQNLLKEIVLKGCISFVYNSWNDVFLSGKSVGTVSIDDIGSGNGGDLAKWNKFSRYIHSIQAYEPNSENREEFEKRKKNLKGGIKGKVEIIPEQYEENTTVNPPPVGVTKLVTSFYSLTLMFDKPETLNNLFDKMDGYEVGTMFATIFMDGDLYNQKVKNKKYECKNNVDGQTNFEIRYPNYMRHKSEKFEPGWNVQVRYDSSQSFITGGDDKGFQNEFATSARYLVGVAAQRGYQIIYNSPVIPQHLSVDEYGFMDEKSSAELSLKYNMLNKCGKEWASIHRILILVKVGDEENIPILRERTDYTRKILNLKAVHPRKEEKARGGLVKNVTTIDDDTKKEDIVILEDWDDIFGDDDVVDIEHDLVTPVEEEKDEIIVLEVNVDDDGDFFLVGDTIPEHLVQDNLEDIFTGSELIDVVDNKFIIEFRNVDGLVVDPDDVVIE